MKSLKIVSIVFIVSLHWLRCDAYFKYPVKHQRFEKVKCSKKSLIEMHELRIPRQNDLTLYQKILLSHLRENETIIRWYIAKLEGNEAILEYVSSLDISERIT